MATEKTEADFEDLNEQQKAFCREYVFDWNQTKAYMKAYNNDNYQSCAASAAKLLKIPKINDYIDFIKKDLAKLAGISPVKNLVALKNIAYSSINAMGLGDLEDLTEQELQKIESKFSKNAIAAIQEINRMLGFNAPDKVQHSGSVEVIDEASRLERIAALRTKLEGK